MRSSRRFSTTLAALILGLCQWAISISAMAATFTVTNRNDSGVGSLRQAMLSALATSADDEIVFATGANGVITLASPLPELTAAGGDLIITGNGAANTIIDGGNAHRMFTASFAASLDITVRQLTLRNARANNEQGSVFYLRNMGSLTVDAVEFVNNFSTYDGGAIWAGDVSSTTIRNSLFLGNQTNSSGSAIWVGSGTLLLSNSTFTENSSAAVIELDSSSARLVNLTLTGNTANRTVTAWSGAVVSISNSLLVDNTLGDLEVTGATITVATSLNNVINSAGNSGIADGVNGNQVGSFASLLGPLGNYGGPTRTIPLLPGSPALNRGTTSGGDIPSADQRGIARVGDVDIGAYESRGFSLSLVSGNNQSATVGTAFASPLVVQLTANQAAEPVQGGVVNFAAPGSGSSATLSGSNAAIGSDGRAQVIATANAPAGGPYTVTAAAVNGTGPALSTNFSLTNVAADPCSAFTFPYTLAGADNAARVANLIQAIRCANATPAADVIDLDGQMITLTAPESAPTGVGLPAITSTLTLRNGSITRNSGSRFRFFHVYPNGNLSLERVTLSNGASSGAVSDGGAIYNDGAVTLLSSVLSGNETENPGFGGGVFNASTATLRVYNSLIAGNWANDAGGGIRNRGTLIVANSTIGGNFAGVIGGGIANAGGYSMTVHNSVIFGNESPTSPQIEGAGTTASSLIGVDPGFVDLPDASDTAPTTAGDYRLGPASAAVDAGDNALIPAGVTTDLNGDPRRYDDTGVPDTGQGTAPIVDIGAYERQANSDPCPLYTYPYTLSGANNAARVANLIQAIQCANQNGASADVIDLDGYALELSAAFGTGTGLPQINTPITIRNGTLARTGSNEFRFFHVAAFGELTLRGMALLDGGGPSFSSNGGSISATLLSAITLVDTRIAASQTTASANGSAVFSSASLTMVNSRVLGGSFGRGALAVQNGPLLIQNSVISGSSGSSINSAGGLYLSNVASATIVNSTITGNYSGSTSATYAGGIVAETGTVNLTLRNSIVWGNRNNNASTPQIVNTTGGTTTVTTSLIEGGQFGALASDPLFVASVTAAALPSTGGDLQLGALSPAIDAGNNAHVPQDALDVNNNGNTTEEAVDLAGAPRRYDDTGVADTGLGTAPIVDIGAYERQTNSVQPQADLSITKSDGVTEAVPGGSVTYTITAINPGPAAVTGATVTDTFPASLSCMWTCVGAGGGTCSSGGSSHISDNTVNLPVDATVTYLATCAISAAATGTLSNTATITAPNGINDPVPGNNSATDTTTLLTLPTLSIDDVSRNEGNTGTTAFDFTVSLSSAALAGGVSFNIATANGTAVEPADYIARNLTAQTIPAGSNSYTFSVQVNGDSVVEPNETFFVNVSNVAGATVSDSQGVGTIVNDDLAGITVSPTSGLVTTEAGGTATFTVVLDSQPTADVTIPLASSDTTEGTVAPASLSFTPANWNLAQTVTVTGVDDAIVDGHIAYTATVGPATSTDANYSGVSGSSVALTNEDDDSAGVTVSPSNGLVTTEAGGTATFTVVLNSQPAANVTVPLVSSDTTEGTVAPTSLSFTAANWNTAQTVTVTGVDDQIADGDQPYHISTGPVSSADPAYNGIEPASVWLTNTDDDIPGITVSPTSGLITSEAGGTATFTVVLNTQPTASVTLPLSSSDTTEGTVAPALLTFTTTNWKIAQTVTVTGVDDAIVDGDVAYTIQTGAAVSTDPVYNGMNAADVAVTNTDNDSAGITVTPVSGLVTTEAGGTATFTVVLNSQPSADVSIPVVSSDATEGTVVPASLTFTSANWNSAQTVTITGVDDALVDGDVAYSVSVGPATSTDASYSGISGSSVAVTNTDNDSAGISVSPTSGLVTTEAGGTATFTVVLNSQPSADVSIPVVSSDATEGTVAPASLTFTAANWNSAQTVTVTGRPDSSVDGDIGYLILIGPSTSADPDYDQLTAASVQVTNTDHAIQLLQPLPVPVDNRNALLLLLLLLTGMGWLVLRDPASIKPRQ